MGRVLGVVFLVGCSNAASDPPPVDDMDTIADLASPNDAATDLLVDMGRYRDLATSIDFANGRDLQGVVPDLSNTSDLRPIPDLAIVHDLTPIQIDFAFYPGCGAPGLPTGASCNANADCCHGLCDSATHQPPRTCCYAKGTNCQSNGDCCSGFCIMSTMLCN